jgi:putative membrane protein
MLWVKSLHIIFLVTWFAGLFYLPRLFVYHSMAAGGDREGIERFKVMERKLFFGILTPGGLLTVVFGLWLWVGTRDAIFGTWLYWKLALVAALVVFHLYCGKLLLDFKYDRNRHGHVYYRWLNEIPTLILIAVVFLTVIKPF